MKKNKIPGLTIALYILAGLLLIYAAWAFMSCRNDIAGAIAAGQLVAAGYEYEIVSYYMSGSGPYAVYAVIFLALGRLLQQPARLKASGDDAKREKAPPDDDEDDFEDWFRNSRN